MSQYKYTVRDKNRKLIAKTNDLTEARRYLQSPNLEDKHQLSYSAEECKRLHKKYKSQTHVQHENIKAKTGHGSYNYVTVLERGGIVLEYFTWVPPMHANK